MIVSNPSNESKSNQCSASAASRLKLHHGAIDSSYDPAAPPHASSAAFEGCDGRGHLG